LCIGLLFNTEVDSDVFALGRDLLVPMAAMSALNDRPLLIVFADRALMWSNQINRSMTANCLGAVVVVASCWPFSFLLVRLVPV
jgi:hypothetical protein